MYEDAIMKMITLYDNLKSNILERGRWGGRREEDEERGGREGRKGRKAGEEEKEWGRRKGTEEMECKKTHC